MLIIKIDGQGTKLGSCDDVLIFNYVRHKCFLKTKNFMFVLLGLLFAKVFLRIVRYDLLFVNKYNLSKKSQFKHKYNIYVF